MTALTTAPKSGCAPSTTQGSRRFGRRRRWNGLLLAIEDLHPHAASTCSFSMTTIAYGRAAFRDWRDRSIDTAARLRLLEREPPSTTAATGGGCPTLAYLCFATSGLRCCLGGSDSRV